METTQAIHSAALANQTVDRLDDRLGDRLDDRLGEQRFWYWRGWRIRYTHLAETPETAGKTPFLLLHGAGSSLEQWRENMTALAKDRPVYAMDLLGFGGSQKVASEVNTDLWVAQTEAFCQTFFDQPIVLMGHSLGALVALQMTASYPQKISRLMMLTLPAARQELAGSAAKVGAVVERWFASPLLVRPLFWIARSPSLIRKILKALSQDPTKIDDDLIDSFVRPTQERGAARMFCYLVKSRTSDSFSPLTRDLIPLINVPTLLLWGKCDRVIPITWGQYVNRLNPQLTFVEVENAGHFLYDESAPDLHNLIDQWLAGELPETNEDLIASEG